MSGRIWSVYQLAIFDWIAGGSGSAVVQARAGCAKTTTAVEGLRHIPTGKTAAYVAFAKANVDDLQEKVPEGFDPRNVLTLHSHAYKALRAVYPKARVDGRKTTAILKAKLSAEKPEDAWPKIKLAGKLASLAKNMLVAPDDADGLAMLLDAFDMNASAKERATIVALTQHAMRAALADKSTIDFDDMIWIPVVENLSFRKFDFLFVDEAQDLNACQIQIVLRSIRRGGRVLAIGDDRQAIYQFRGADSDAMANIVRALNARTLPLSITYRCPKSVVAEVSEIVPDYRAHESNADGEVVRDLKPDAMLEKALPGDFILSRTNAPLLRIAFGLIRQGTRCNIAGRDIGDMLTSFVKKSKSTTIDALLDYVDTWYAQEAERLIKRDPDADTSVLDDKAECIRALCENVQTISELLAAIDALFPDRIDDAGRVVLSTVHRAKGLERERVWMLRDTFLRRRRSKDGGFVEPGAEEYNLFYVACTRAKKSLFMVRGK